MQSEHVVPKPLIIKTDRHALNSQGVITMSLNDLQLQIRRK